MKRWRRLWRRWRHAWRAGAASWKYEKLAPEMALLTIYLSVGHKLIEENPEATMKLMIGDVEARVRGAWKQKYGVT